MDNDVCRRTYFTLEMYFICRDFYLRIFRPADILIPVTVYIYTDSRRVHAGNHGVHPGSIPRAEDRARTVGHGAPHRARGVHVAGGRRVHQGNDHTGDRERGVQGVHDHGRAEAQRAGGDHHVPDARGLPHQHVGL